MPKYKVVNTTEFAFEKECQKLIDEGYRPCSGITIYEIIQYCNYTYKNLPKQYFVQSFMNNIEGK